MKTTIKEITPQWASQILETRNPQNRKLSERTVSRYANDIMCGNWCLTHQGIAFDENGDLLDGQHRLAAVVKAAKPVQMMVTSGIPKAFKNNGHTTSVFGAIDGLRCRTPATTLELLGHKNCKLSASIARAFAMLCCGGGHSKINMSGGQCQQIVELTGNSIPKIAEVSTGSRIVRIRSGGLAALAFWHTKFPAEAETFLLETQTVSGSPKSPSRALAKANARAACGGGQVTIDQICIAATAISYHVGKASVEKLYGSQDSIKWLLSNNKTLAAAIKSMFKK